MLLENGAYVDAKDNAKRTPLHHAAQNGTANLAIVLLSNGADVNAKDSNGLTPLHLAINYPKQVDRAVDIVRVLLEKGADINAKDEGGLTPLMGYINGAVLQLIDLNNACLPASFKANLEKKVNRVARRNDTDVTKESHVAPI